MSKTLFRNTVGAADAAALLAVHEACFSVDQIDLQSSEEYRPTLDWYTDDLAQSDPRDWIIAVLEGQIVGYGHTMWNWSERDGSEVYLHLGWVIPEARGQGIGSELLLRLEQRCQEKAAENQHLANLEIAANASSTEFAAQDLLRKSNYFVGFTMLEMRLAKDHVLEVLPSLPLGYELRPVLPEHHLAIWQCIGDAYDARNMNNKRFAEAILKADFEPYFSGDSSLKFVAWELQAERIAGQVLCRVLKNGKGEIYEVSVGIGHRRKGIAKTLLLIALHEMRSRGVQEFVLGTRQENSTEAWRLYEQVGFTTAKAFPRWRKKK